MHQGRARVRKVLAAAARLVDPRDPLGREARAALPAVTGLSAEGVALGLAEHLETAATDAELGRLLAWAGEAPRVHVVLSANVFVGAVRALALAVAASEVVMVKPSRREPVVARLLACALDEAGGAHVELVAALDVAPLDHVHAYGSDASIRALRGALPASVRLRAHGTGLGVAAIDAPVDAERAADRLAADVVAFDQRGCLSPRLALVAPGADPPRFAASLAAALERRGVAVPRGALADDEQAAASMWRDAVAMSGDVFEGDSYLVGLDPSPRALLLPPPGRNVHLVIAEPAQVEALLAPLAPAITTIGQSSRGPLARAAALLAPRARVAPLGLMQKPPLDGPVDRREE